MTSDNAIASQIGRLGAELKTFIDNTKGEVKDTISAVRTLQERIDDMDRRHVNGGGSSYAQKGGGLSTISKTIADTLVKGVPYGTSFNVPSPILALEGKTLTSSGLIAADTTPMIGSYGGWRYGNIRQLFRAVPCNSGEVFAVKETGTAGWNVSPQQGEGATKNESVVSLTGETLSIATLATWIAVSKQAMQDVEGLSAFLESRLLWALAAEVDLQIYSGDSTGSNLSGLTVAATAFDTSLLPSAALGYTYIDTVGAGCAQVRIAGWQPNFILLNPADAFTLGFTKDDQGNYLKLPNLPPIVENTAVTAGTFCCGDSRGALLRVRHEAVIDVSESHSDFFVRNQAAVRIEERLAFQVMSPTAFVYGSLASSPAA